jgi:membrane-associated protease RseP (regulator of RpoE activity)
MNEEPAPQRDPLPPAAPPVAPPGSVLSAEVGDSPAEPVYPELKGSDFDRRFERRPLRRRVRLPILLFLATCLSTFWVGCADWRPTDVDKMQTWPAVAQTITSNWKQGVEYMLAVLAILLAHEMGHFVLTLIHRIPASYPLCIPVPFNPIGTMGAVIGMEGMRANRREIFDIGLAGPLAGLIVALPILWVGVGRLDVRAEPLPGEVQLYNPVAVRWMLEAQHPQVAPADGESDHYWIGVSQVNSLFMAGWVGMLVTGLNMLPISQLDGGHTIYGLFGRDAQSVARGFLVVAITYVVMNLEAAAVWAPMLVLVILMGVDHPPTSDDEVELDTPRWVLGAASLAIPVLCFPLLGLKQ